MDSNSLNNERGCALSWSVRGSSRMSILLVLLGTMVFSGSVLAQDGQPEADELKMEYKLLYLNVFLGARDFKTDAGGTIQHADLGAEFGSSPLEGLGWAFSMKYYTIELKDSDIDGTGLSIGGDLYYTMSLSQQMSSMNWFLRTGALLDFGFATVKDSGGLVDGEINDSALRPYLVAGARIDGGDMDIMFEGGALYEITIDREGAFDLGGGALLINGDIEPDSDFGLMFNSLITFGAQRQHGISIGVRLLNETILRAGYTFRF